MSKRSCNPEKKWGILRDVTILRGKGKSEADSCREVGVNNVVEYYRWKKQYGRVDANQAKSLKTLKTITLRKFLQKLCWIIRS